MGEDDDFEDEDVFDDADAFFVLCPRTDRVVLSGLGMGVTLHMAARALWGSYRERKEERAEKTRARGKATETSSGCEDERTTSPPDRSRPRPLQPLFYFIFSRPPLFLLFFLHAPRKKGVTWAFPF